MTETTTLSFSSTGNPMWGGNGPSLDYTYALVDYHYRNSNSFGLSGNIGFPAGFNIDMTYGADFDLDARVRWDLGDMDVAYDVEIAVPTTELVLNEVVHFDTSGFEQVNGTLTTSGLDPANLQFDLTMSYGAFAQFDLTSGLNFAGYNATLADFFSQPVSIFNLAPTTNTLFSANASDILNGSLPLQYPGSFLDILFQLPLDPLVTSDIEGNLPGALSDLVSSGSSINFLEAGIDLDRVIAAFFGSPTSPLGVDIPLFTDPGGGVLRFYADLFDATASLNFRIDQTFEFTPNPIKVHIQVAETGQVINGELGDDFVLDTPAAGYGIHHVYVEYALSGELRNLTQLVLEGQLTIDFLKAGFANTILAPGFGFDFQWGPVWSMSKAWDLLKVTIFDETFDIDLGTIAFNYEIPWERFYVGTAGNDAMITLTPHQVSYDGLGGNDVTVGNALDNVIRGGTGDDRILGMSGADTLDGGDDTDIVSYGYDEGGVLVNLSSVDWVVGGVTVEAGTALDSWGYVDRLANFENIIGSVHDDVLIARDEGSVIAGLEGDDVIYGRGGVDTLLGESGSDEIHGGAGNDIVQGGAGDDLLYGDGDDDLLMGQSGDDTLDGGEGIDLADYQVDTTRVIVNLGLSGVLVDGISVASMRGLDSSGDTDTLIAIEGAIGTDFDDHFFGGAGRNEFYGRKGNDTFYASTGDDLLVGEQGDDVYYVNSGATDVWDNRRNTGGGHDTVYSSVDFDLGIANGHRSDIEDLHITGTAIRATGNALNNLIVGNSRDNIIDGGSGGDEMVGGDGDDVYVFDSTADRAVELAGEGHDTIHLAVAGLAVGTPQNGFNPVAGFDMEAVASEVEDLILTDSTWRINIDGNARSNLIVANARDNVIHGRGGNDTIVSAGGADVIHGDEGNDTAIFSLSLSAPATSEFHGGDDVDTLVMDWSAATNGIVWNAGYYATFVDNYGTVYLHRTGVERWQLTGGAGSDDLRGGALDDILIGGGGNDALYGYAGKGTYHGGAGIDTVLETTIASTASKNFVLSLAAAQLAEVVVNSGTDIETRWSGVEFVRLTTGSGDDILDVRGTNAIGQHVFNAGAGDDTFKIDLGSRGEHYFLAGEGTDTLVLDWSASTNGIVWNAGYYATFVDNYGTVYVHRTGVERWQLTGGAGNDDLRGGALDDILIGGAGNDALRGYQGKGTYNGGAGNDTVLETSVASASGKNFVLSLAAAQLGEVVVNAGTDIETRWSGIEFVQIATGSGNDTLDVRGTNANGQHVFDSGAGDDTFRIDLGSRGEHYFLAGEGTDTLVLDWSAATNGIVWNAGYYATAVDGYGTVYVHRTGVDRWQITGGAGSDDLRGGALDDVLIGGGGHDALRGFEGKGTFNGGAGIDTVLDTSVASAVGKDFVLSLAAAQLAEVVVNAGTDIETKWQGIEFVRIATGAGNDTLDVRGTNANGQHVFDSGAGDDTFRIDLGSRGEHVFHGGEGTDTLVLDWGAATNGIVWNAGYYATAVDNYGTVYVHRTGVERWQLTGGSGNDDLRGGTMDDVLIGGAGRDQLRGDRGQGIYDGGDGQDVVFANIRTATDQDLGLDFTLRLAEAQGNQIVVNAGTAVETRWKDVEVVQLVTGAGNDTLDARGVVSQSNVTGYNFYFGAGSGDDTFAIDLGSRGEHTFDGGEGTDTLVLDWSAALDNIGWNAGYYYTYVNGWGHVYVHRTGVERWHLTGGLGIDDLRGGALDDILIGGAGDDVLRGYEGKGTYFGGDGVDTVLDTTIASAAGKDFVLSLSAAQTGPVTVNAGTDIETRWQGVEFVRVSTGAGNDSLDVRGTDAYGQHVFNAGAGNDTFVIDLGSRGEHYFTAGEGTDTLVMDWSAATHNISWNAGYYSTYVEGSGTTYMHRTDVERWQLTGGSAHDDLRGGALDDILVGGGGDDALRGYEGKGTFVGGDGTDTVLETTIASTTSLHFVLSLADAQAGLVTVNAGTAIETRWQGIEFVQISTGAGNDVLDVRGTNAAGQHVFLAAAGDDTFRIDLGSRGDHVYTAGEGTDTLVIDWSAATNNIGWNGGYYATYVDGYGTVYMNHSSVERFELTGGAGNDDLRGGALNDMLKGNGGNDRLEGGLGDDIYVTDGLDEIIEGEDAGTDTVQSSVDYTLGANLENLTLIGTALVGTGNALANTITGNASNNTLNGGLGNDVLNGGLGDDIFVFNTVANSTTNRDTVIGFSNVAGNNDTIHLENAVFTGLAAGALKAVNFFLGAAARDADDYIIYNQQTGVLSYDADGNGTGSAIQIAQFSNMAALTVSDFVVI